MADLRKIWVRMALLVALLPAQARAEEAEVKAREKADEWRKAALNRELAALPRAADADKLRDVAQALRVKRTETAAEQRQNIEKAGDIMIQAGAMEQASAVSLEAAVANWHRSAAEYAKAGDESKRDRANANARSAAEQALVTLDRAAECFEAAAQDFSRPEVDRTDKAAVASDQAAMMREKLAASK